MLAELAEACPEADLATTTSSLSVGALAAAAATPTVSWACTSSTRSAPHGAGRAVPSRGVLRDGAADRARRWCEALGKTAVEVPDTAGFVVNRLLFPYLFDAVRLLDSTGMSPRTSTRACAWAPAIRWVRSRCSTSSGWTSRSRSARACEARPASADHRAPDRLRALVDAGRLGRKSGRGFFELRRVATAGCLRGCLAALSCPRGPRSRRPRRCPGGGRPRSTSSHGSCASGRSSQRASSSASSEPRSAGPRCSSERSTALRTSSCLSVSRTTHMAAPSLVELDWR